MTDKIDESKTILMLGIGGVSMHQLALALKSIGKTVYGYDAKNSNYVKLLKENNVFVSNRFMPELTNVDLCITTGAINKNDKFVQELKKSKVKIIDRAELLSWFCKKFKCVIAVAGTHGKSTTASLIYEILRSAGKKVSCHIGADVYLPRFDLTDEYLVVEACEFRKSFLTLYPHIAIVTNIEAEHMDCYGSMFALRNAFQTFLKRAQTRFVHLNDSTKFLTKKDKFNFVDINENSDIRPQLRGKHNLINISLAIETCKHLGICEKNIIKTVNKFSGIPRRYEFIGMSQNCRVYIDYAHHPSEIEAFISSFKEEYRRPLIVFQPHTYSRTRMLLDDFIRVLSNVDNLILYKEYPAREKPTSGKSAKELYEILRKSNKHIKYAATGKSIRKHLTNEHDAIAFVGAGDINLVAKKFIHS